MELRKARLILSLECSRKCEYCCNNEETLRLATKIMPKDLLSLLPNYDEISVTGGEPAEYGLLIGMLQYIKICNPNIKTYLYSAKYTPLIRQALAWCEGLTYTMHNGCSYTDVNNFKRLQDDIGSMEFMQHSFRLTIHPKCNAELPIYLPFWNKIKIQDFIPAGQVCLPPDEDFYILEDDR